MDNGGASEVDRELIYELRRGSTPWDPKVQGKESLSVRVADRIASFAGSVNFFLLNLGWFTAWILVNTLVSGAFRFDPFPFQFLTMAVSLEAIFLSIFVLISENRQAAKDRVMIEQDYETNRRSETESRVLLERVLLIEELLEARLPRRED